jgi:hypothetical protein
MRKVALTIAATLVLMVVSPAFSQPFADVPTDHWAFDAIAELAAKGIVEGYPDGTFKGDRAMTRYEMAMVVARLLARVEAIKIPPATPPTKIPPAEVGRADIQTLQRLVNEFRAELAALGVRVTAVEEELAALRARVDNTRVTGFTFFRYQADIRPGVNPNYTFGLFNLTFNGQASSTASVTMNLLVDDGGGGVFGFGTPGCSSPSGSACSGTYPSPGVTYDRAYLDARAWGFGWRLGRQTYRMGPVGLLFNEAAVAINGGNSQGIDGLKITGAFGPVNFEAAGFTHIENADLTAQVSLLMARIALGLLPGWTFGANFYTERHNQTSPTPNAAHTGWSVDVNGGLLPGVTLAAEYATFTPSGGASQTAYQVNATLNLGQLTGMMSFAPSLRLQYKQYPTTWTPVFRGSSDMFALGGAAGTGAGSTTDYNAWNARLQLTFSPQFRPYVNYESGRIISSGVTQTELEFGFFSLVTTAVTAQFRYQLRTLGGATATNRYRLQIDTSW